MKRISILVAIGIGLFGFAACSGGDGAIIGIPSTTGAGGAGGESSNGGAVNSSSSGISSGSMNSSSNSSSSSSSNSGGVCSVPCASNLDCLNNCGVPSTGFYCCNQDSNICYVSGVSCSGQSGSSSSSSSSGSSTCSVPCASHTDCANNCSAPPFGVNCCDIATNICYVSGATTCPGQSGSSSSSSSSGMYP
ncbi:MAG TPA: hypothetical protein PK156_11690 [Polyangium sp.]|nr:hypothetical protein [Polyangium sp.]